MTSELPSAVALRDAAAMLLLLAVVAACLRPCCPAAMLSRLGALLTARGLGVGVGAAVIALVAGGDDSALSDTL